MPRWNSMPEPIKRVSVTVRVPTSLAKQLRAIAKTRGLSVNAMMIASFEKELTHGNEA